MEENIENVVVLRGPVVCDYVDNFDKHWTTLSRKREKKAMVEPNDEEVKCALSDA